MKATLVTAAGAALNGVTLGAVDLDQVTDSLKAAEPELDASKEEIIRDEFKTIVAKLRTKSRQRVVIAIDNLDRCRPEAALQVLESLHLLRDTEGCTFVVAADQHVLVSFLNRHYLGTEFNGVKYLEKVFPDYFRIPDPYVKWEFDYDYTRADGSGLDDQIVKFLRRVLQGSGNWGRKDSDVVHLLWAYFAQSRVLRNPRRIKRILRRIAENKLPAFDGEHDGECVLFLVILSDIWPTAYEFFLNTDEKTWSDWVDLLSGASANQPAWPGYPDGEELRSFLRGIREYHEDGYFDTCPIRDASMLWDYVDWVVRLGL